MSCRRLMGKDWEWMCERCQPFRGRGGAVASSGICDRCGQKAPLVFVSGHLLHKPPWSLSEEAAQERERQATRLASRPPRWRWPK